MIQQSLGSVRKVMRGDGSVWAQVDGQVGHLVRLAMDEVLESLSYVRAITWQWKERAAFLHAQMANVSDRMTTYAVAREKRSPLS